MACAGKMGRGARKLSVFFFKLNIENKQLFEQKNFKSKLENEKLTFIFVIFGKVVNNLGKNIFHFYGNKQFIY